MAHDDVSKFDRFENYNSRKKRWQLQVAEHTPVFQLSNRGSAARAKPVLNFVSQISRDLYHAVWQGLVAR